jgi:beta-hydroxylase
MTEQYFRPRQSKAVKFGKRLRKPLNRFLARQSLISTDRFIDPGDVPGLDVLKENWEAIRDEALAVMAGNEEVPSLGRISPDHRRIAPDEAWKSFFFNAYGYSSLVNRSRCPRTAEVIDKVPNVVVAFYSIFDTGTRIPLHKGVTKAMLNVHLGLSVPPEKDACGIRVEGEVRHWQEGELLVFDETNRHEAWNDSSQPRIVLFLQVMRPMNWLGRLVGKAFLALVKRTTYVQDVRKALGV